MSRPLYYVGTDSRVAGLRSTTGRLERRPLAGEWINPAEFHDDPSDLDLFRDLYDEAGNGWSNGTPGHRFRRHADGSIEMRGYLEPGTSGTVAYTLPGAIVTEVDYRPDVDTSFIGDVKTSPTSFILARIEIDSTTGDVTVTYPAS